MAVEHETLPTVTYRRGADLPDLPIWWRAQDRTLLDFSTGWTFKLVAALVSTPATIALTKTTGLLGAAGATDPPTPNLLVAWAVAGELNTLAAGTYLCEIEATRTIDGAQRVFAFRLVLRPRLGP